MRCVCMDTYIRIHTYAHIHTYASTDEGPSCGLEKRKRDTAFTGAKISNFRY
jgi:hypothetical protein